MNARAPKSLPGEILQHIRDAVLLTDAKGKILFANAQFLALTGYRAQEIFGKHDRLFQIRKSHKLPQRNLQSGWMMRTKNGNPLSVTINTIALPKNGTLRIFTNLMSKDDPQSDFAPAGATPDELPGERKTVSEVDGLINQSLLRHRESRACSGVHTNDYRQMVENMNEAAIRIDKHNTTLYVNPKYCEMTGYSSGELLGKLCSDIFDEETNRRMMIAGRKHRKTGERSQYEVTMVKRDGTHVPVLISGSLLPNGDVVGIMTNLSDVKRRESMHRILIESMEEGVYMTDAFACPIYANPAFLKLTGYTQEELLQLKECDLWDEKTARHIEHLLETDRKQGISSSYEGTLVTKKGVQIPVSVRGTPLPDGGTIGIITDLTAIRKEERRYRQLVEQMTEIVWLLDASYKTVYVNPRFTSLTGYTLEEAKGRPPSHFFDAESAKRMRWVFKHERARGISSNYEATLIGKSGEQFSVMISGSPDLTGGFIGVITDITALRKSERNERILSSAVAYANDAMIVVGPTMRIESWNKGAKIMFGYRAQEMIGQSLERIFSRADIAQLCDKKNVHYNRELQGKHKNSHLVMVSATSTLVRTDSDSRGQFHLLVIRDVSPQHKYDAELTLKYQKLREAYDEFGIVRRQMDYMCELAELRATSNDLKILGNFIVSAVIMLTKVDACALRIYRPQNDSLELIASFGLDHEWRGRKVVPLKATLVKRAFDRGGPFQCVDLMSEPSYSSKHLARKSNFVSALVIPLMAGPALIGGLTLYVKPDKKMEVFENDFIERFCKLVSVALATAKG